MSLYGISDTQLERLMYPNGRGNFHMGNTPIFVNQTGQQYQGVQPGEVYQIGTHPVQPAVAVNDNPAAGIVAGQVAPGATGAPAGAVAGGVPGAGASGYASLAGAAIQGIADTANTYVAGKEKETLLRNQKPVFNIPESTGAAGAFTPPALAFA